MSFTICKYGVPALVPEIFISEFEKHVKYTNEMTDDVIHSTRYRRIPKVMATRK